MAESCPLLELNDIAKAFGTRLLFRHVHLSIMPGELSLLAGANGSGKTTLMRIMAGLSRPDAGAIVRPLNKNTIGYLAHTPFLYSGLTAEENLMFWAKVTGIPNPARRIAELLDTVELTHHAHEQVGIFSRGMAQRLNLARLLLPQPGLLLLDEPATGLDTASRSLLKRLLNQERSRGAAIVWISHDVKEDAFCADHIFTLREKTIYKTPGELSC